MRKLIIYFACILTAVFILAPKAHSSAEEEFHHTCTVDAGTEVAVKNINGNIQISTWEKNYVDIHALKKTKKGHNELDKVTIEVETNGILRIETVKNQSYKEDSFFKRIFGINVSWPKVDVEYTIKLPTSLVLSEVITTNAKIALIGTRGNTTARTTNGTINLDDCEGTIEAKTTNGNITIAGGAHVRLARSTNGSISVTDGATLSEAKSTNGSIKTSLPDELTESTNFSTINGSIDLYLSPDINAEIEMKTVNGSISARGFRIMLDTISRKHILGTLGSGGETITARTVNGSINLYEK